MNVCTWTSEEQCELARLAAAGLKVADIAAALGYTRNAIIGRARRTGVELLYRPPPAAPKPPREPREPRQRHTEEVVARVRELYIGGATYAIIESETGANRGSIPYLVRDLPRRRAAVRTAPYDFAFRVAAVAAVLTGESYDKAAARLGTSHASIVHWKRRPEILEAAQGIADRVKSAWAAEQVRQRRIAEAEAEAERVRVEAHNAPIFAQMPPRARIICQRRIEGHSLEAIGNDHGITRERVRQIEIRWRGVGLIVPGANPLSEAARRYVPTGVPRGPKPKLPSRPRGRPPKAISEARALGDFWAEAHAILDTQDPRPKRKLHLSDAERQRRSDWIRKVAHKRWEARA